MQRLDCFLDLPPEDNVGASISKYELVDGSQIIHTEIEDFKVRLYAPQELIAALQEGGFSEIKMHKTFEIGNLPAGDDEVVVYECIK